MLCETPFKNGKGSPPNKPIYVLAWMKPEECWWASRHLPRMLSTLCLRKRSSLPLALPGNKETNSKGSIQIWQSQRHESQRSGEFLKQPPRNLSTYPKNTRLKTKQNKNFFWADAGKTTTKKEDRWLVFPSSQLLIMFHRDPTHLLNSPY